VRKFVNASTLDFLSTFYTYEELRFGSMAGCVFFFVFASMHAFKSKVKPVYTEESEMRVGLFFYGFGWM